MDKKEALKQIKAGDFSLKDAGDKLKADKEIVLAAVKGNGNVLEYADEKLKADKEVVLAAVKQNGSALSYADEKLKADKEPLSILEAKKVIANRLICPTPEAKLRGSISFNTFKTALSYPSGISRINPPTRV